MGKRTVLCACSISVVSLLLACSAGRDDSETIDVVGDPRFELVDASVTMKDHSSTGGVSWVDYDGDGDIDLFVTNGYDVSADQPHGQKNRLYRNDGISDFDEIGTGSLVAGNEISSGSTWGDFDNDGDLDVFIANQQDLDNLLYRNEGEGVFTPIDDEPQVTDGGHSYAASWMDVDRDGWLDLFVANGGMSHVGRNGLYRGTGDGHFEKITSGDIVEDEAATCGIAWGDYDNDGDQDLLLANRGFAPPANNNVLYRNDGGFVFTRIRNSAAVFDSLPSCAATWVDVDNDLDLDLHVTSMYGLADILYLNDGSGGLSRVEGSPLTLDGGHSYGANWQDYDNDGDIDCVVANWGAAPSLYLNDGNGGFEFSSGGDLGGRIHFAGAIASGDFNMDGRVDVYIGNWPNRPGAGELNALYRNTGDRGHWIRVRLVGRGSNKSGIGARVVVTSRQRERTISQMREVQTQTGFRGQSDILPHFGLGEAAEASSIEVRWPSGKVSKISNVEADRTIVVEEQD